MYCNPNGFARLVEPAPGAYFVWSREVCEGCGKCIEVCPCGFLSNG
jgi:ferredoxin